MELLLAVAMSELYQKHFVLFLPPQTKHQVQLKECKRKKLITNISQRHYKLTPKGWIRLKQHRQAHFGKVDKEIDEFVDKL